MFYRHSFAMNASVFKSWQLYAMGRLPLWQVWYGMVWYGMVWYGMVWYGMVWYGMVYFIKDSKYNIDIF